MSDNKYSVAISRVEKIIEHWFDKKELKKHLFIAHYGLCFNVLTGLDISSHKCIQDYLKSQGIAITEDLVYYPIEGSKFLYNLSSDTNTLYDNPKRLHLAVYMLSWLRQHA